MSGWTEDRVDRLKRLWREGRTAAAIARDLGPGVSRCAVLGKVHRLGLSALRSPSPAAPGAGPRKARRRPVPKAPSPPGPEIGRTLPVAGARTILTVRRGDCRWPIGDPQEGGFSLCGAAASRGAYCAAHAAVAYRGASVSAESLVSLAGVASVQG